MAGESELVIVDAPPGYFAAGQRVEYARLIDGVAEYCPARVTAVNKGRATLALTKPDPPHPPREQGDVKIPGGLRTRRGAARRAGDRGLTWAEVADRSERLSGGYARLGLRAGMRDWQQTARRIWEWPAAELKLRATAGLVNCLLREEQDVIELLAARIAQDGASRYAAARALLKG